LRTLSLYGQPSRLPTRSCQELPALAIEPFGIPYGIRTLILYLAKVTLSQLS